MAALSVHQEEKGKESEEKVEGERRRYLILCREGIGETNPGRTMVTLKAGSLAKVAPGDTIFTD